MIRLLYQTHRWGGIALAVFMVMWLVSGLIIAYTGPITQSHKQQLGHGQILTPTSEWLSLGAAWEKSAPARDALRQQMSEVSEQSPYAPPSENEIASARLISVGGQPQWQVEDIHHHLFVLSAIDGSVQTTSPQQAQKIAQLWLDNPDATYQDTLDATSSLRNYKELSPFHRVLANDEAGTELLISARTGEVLQAATQLQRGLYLAGNWLHFFRPLESLGAVETRRDVLMWAGFIATVAALTGMIIGWLRWKPGYFGKPTYSQGRTQPYRTFWLKWHFWAGLIGGTAAVLWTLSGYLNNNPWALFSTATASPAELTRFQGVDLPNTVKSWRPEELKASTTPNIVEIEWRHLGPKALLLAYTRDGQRLAQPIAGTAALFDKPAIQTAAQHLGNKAPIVSITTLDHYDNYYYPLHNRDISEKPLPITRVELADAGHSYLYVDPMDGRVLSKLDTSRRIYRWVFSAIHRWDFGWLYLRPIWDVWFLTIVGLGLVLSVSSVVLGWRRLKRTFAASNKQPAEAPVVQVQTAQPVS